MRFDIVGCDVNDEQSAFDSAIAVNVFVFDIISMF